MSTRFNQSFKIQAVEKALSRSGVTTLNDIASSLGIGCSTLKELLEENRMELCDRDVITELMTFISKGTSFEADRGFHDDLVMNLVLFSWFVTTDHFYHLTDRQVKELLYSEQQKKIEDDILPPGIFDTGQNNTESFVDADGDRWFLD